MSSNQLVEKCAEHRKHIQESLPSNCHAIVILVEEVGNNQRYVVWSATSTIQEMQHALSTVLGNSGPF